MYIDAMHNINELLDKIQKHKQLSNYGLAKLLKVSPQYLYKFRKHPFAANPEFCIRIAEESEIEPIELIASVNYRYGKENRQRFWASIYVQSRARNIDYNPKKYYFYKHK